MGRHYYEEQDETRVAPTGMPGTHPVTGEAQGMSVDNIRGFRVVLQAADGQALAGVGALRCYFYHPLVGWMRNRALDLSLASEDSGEAAVAFPDVECVADAEGRVFYATDGVAVTGAATDPAHADKLIVRIDGGEPR